MADLTVDGTSRNGMVTGGNRRSRRTERMSPRCSAMSPRCSAMSPRCSATQSARPEAASRRRARRGIAGETSTPTPPPAAAAQGASTCARAAPELPVPGRLGGPPRHRVDQLSGRHLEHLGADSARLGLPARLRKQAGPMERSSQRCATARCSPMLLTGSIAFSWPHAPKVFSCLERTLRPVDHFTRQPGSRRINVS